MTEPANPALRDHVLRVGFDLSLGKTHVAALVYIDVMIRASRALGQVAYIGKNDVADLGLRRSYAHFATGARGLIERGLVWHSYAGRNLPFHRHYKITRAGRMVIGLLQEAGIYAEYAAGLPEPRPLEALEALAAL